MEEGIQYTCNSSSQEKKVERTEKRQYQKDRTEIFLRIIKDLIAPIEEKKVYLLMSKINQYGPLWKHIIEKL